MAHRPASRCHRVLVVALLALAVAAVLSAAPAEAQAIIKVSDTVNIRFGLLLQPQAEWIEYANPAGTDTVGYQQNLFIRRVRILVGGQVARNVFFFAETENSNLGMSTSTTTGNKSLATGFEILDAVAEWRIAKPFNLQVGLIRVPTSREALKASGSQVPLDFSAWTFLQSTPTQSTAGRDTGFMARGYFFGDRLEYRVAGLEGFRQSGSRNSLRATSRLQYNFFDTEVYNMPSYTSNFLGTKKILAVGAAADLQGDYSSYSADAFWAIPVSSGSVEGTAEFQWIDGGKSLATLPKQQTSQLELLYYTKKLSIAPWVRWEQRNYSSASLVDESRYSVGLSWLIYKTNFMVKTAYTLIDPKKGPSLNQFGVMLHLFYF